MEILVNKDEIILLILDFLKSQNYIKSLVTLESETNVSAENLPEEIKFFRDLILNGDFDTGINFLELFSKAESFPYNHCIYTIKKQQFLELVENNDENEAETLIKLSKDIEKLTTKERYNELCYFLTLKRVSDHPEYATWNIYTGRMSCFNEIKQHLRSALFSNSQKEKEKIKPNSLTKFLTALIRLIFMENKQVAQTLLDPNNNFSFLNSGFFDLVEKHNTSMKLLLKTDKNKEQDSFKAMSKSINFLKNASNLSDFRSFGQSMHIENLKFNLNEQQKPQFQELSHQSQFPNLASHVDVRNEKSQSNPNKNLQKSQQLLQESQQNEIYNKSSKSPLKPDSSSKSEKRYDFEQSLKSEKKQSEIHYPDVKSSSKLESSTYSQGNRIVKPLHHEDSKSPMRKNFEEYEPRSEERKTEYMENSRFTGTRRGEQTLGERSRLTEMYNYEMFSQMEEIGQIQDVQPIRTASFSPDGDLFAIGTNSKSLKIYSMQNLFLSQGTEDPQGIELVFEKNNHHFGSIYSVDWSNTGQFIASGSNDKLIKVVKVPNFKTDTELMELKLPGHKGIVRSIAFTLDDTRLLSGSTDCTVKIWDVQEGVEIRTLEGHTSAIYCLQVSGDGNYCVSVGMDKCLKLWDLRMQECSVSIPVNNYAEMNYVSLRENTKNYSSVRNTEKRRTKGASASEGVLAAVAHTDGVVTLWDINTRKLLKVEELHEADCRSVEFDSSSGLIVTSSFDATVGIYDLNSEKMLNRISNHTDRVVLAKWHPFYPVILSTSADTTARLFAPQKFTESLR